MQHFLLSARARTLSLVQVMRMTDAEAETEFRKVRWPETDGQPVCPHCGSLTVYECRRPNGHARWRCKDCEKDFTITSGTLFAAHKLPLRVYLGAVAVFCNEVKGKSMLAMSRDLGVQYKVAFCLCHKLREAMAADTRGLTVGGEGKTAEIDGAYFGGYVKPANRREDRKDRRLYENRSGKRQVVVVVRERNGRTITEVFPSEMAGLNFIRSRIARGTAVHADEAGGWNDLHAHYEMHRINHQEAYSTPEANTNVAESFFSRLRRAEIGHHHHIAGPYLVRFAQEAAWREDNRRLANGEQVRAVATLAMKCKPSAEFCGYWERAEKR
ncbi:MAG TPA: IS1595 family transposase [Stellaceae bacterium]|jgi:transposase-like protein|nr:IS1595 family transposase [Stellaceae bacterium]